MSRDDEPMEIRLTGPRGGPAVFVPLGLLHDRRINADAYVVWLQLCAHENRADEPPPGFREQHAREIATLTAAGWLNAAGRTRIPPEHR